MRRLLVISILFASGCSEAHGEVGVDIFSTDTLPAQFVVTLTGSLVMGLRSNAFYMRPDKSLVLETPGALVVQKGEGTVTIQSFDSTRKIAVEPVNTPPDFSGRAAVTGTVIRAT